MTDFSKLQSTIDKAVAKIEDLESQVAALKAAQTSAADEQSAVDGLTNTLEGALNLEPPTPVAQQPSAPAT